MVVVAIIAILAALLLPALSRAKAKALQVKCISNQRQIGQAMHMYADDANELYPVHPDWGSVGGNDGSYDVFVAATNRPLNPYTLKREIFGCPADKGDVYRSVASCFGSYGNSYLIQWASPGISYDTAGSYYYSFRTRCVTSGAGRPMKQAEVARHPVNKIIQGDWIWHPNRGTTDPRSIWHNYRGKSLVVMLYGDTHVALTRFPDEAVNWGVSPAPDLLFTWW